MIPGTNSCCNLLDFLDSSMPELELDNVLSDLESYSRNIPTAIPSKTLAVNELR